MDPMTSRSVGPEAPTRPGRPYSIRRSPGPMRPAAAMTSSGRLGLRAGRRYQAEVSSAATCGPRR